MKKGILLLIFILSFSCKYNEVPKPEKMLSEQQMEDIMFDLAILNAARSSDSQILEEHHIVPTKFLYKKYEIDSTEFAQNSIYYAAHPNKYKQIIDAVGKRLNAKRDSIRKQDSINNRNEQLTPIEELEELKKSETPE